MELLLLFLASRRLYVQLMLAVTKQNLLFSLQVLAVILLILSAATAGVIVNNDNLEALRTLDGMMHLA